METTQIVKCCAIRVNKKDLDAQALRSFLFTRIALITFKIMSFEQDEVVVIQIKISAMGQLNVLCCLVIVRLILNVDKVLDEHKVIALHLTKGQGHNRVLRSGALEGVEPPPKLELFVRDGAAGQHVLKLSLFGACGGSIDIETKAATTKCHEGTRAKGVVAHGHASNGDKATLFVPQKVSDGRALGDHICDGDHSRHQCVGAPIPLKVIKARARIAHDLGSYGLRDIKDKRPHQTSIWCGVVMNKFNVVVLTLVVCSANGVNSPVGFGHIQLVSNLFSGSSYQP